MKRFLLITVTAAAAIAASARPAAAAPSWTSYNAHDPGITMLEVLVYAPAWRDWTLLTPR
jgi:hypothetical protein